MSYWLIIVSIDNESDIKIVIKIILYNNKLIIINLFKINS